MSKIIPEGTLTNWEMADCKVVKTRCFPTECYLKLHQEFVKLLKRIQVRGKQSANEIRNKCDLFLQLNKTIRDSEIILLETMAFSCVLAVPYKTSNNKN